MQQAALQIAVISLLAAHIVWIARWLQPALFSQAAMSALFITGVISLLTYVVYDEP